MSNLQNMFLCRNKKKILFLVEKVIYLELCLRMPIPTVVRLSSSVLLYWCAISIISVIIIKVINLQTDFIILDNIKGHQV